MGKLFVTRTGKAGLAAVTVIVLICAGILPGLAVPARAKKVPEVSGFDLWTYDRVMFSRNINQVFSLSETPEWEGVAQTMTAGEVYSLYDELAERYPSYITKTRLGYDDWGNELAIYSASPVQPGSDHPTRIPKIFINCGIHGYEHVPPITAYLMLRMLCEDWATDDMLNVLRHEVVLHILPVANPSGFTDYTRKNRNGVDLNRNFQAGFSTGTARKVKTYSGKEALSEKETWYITRWLENNRDIDILLDFHNFGDFKSKFVWVSVRYGYQAHIAQTLIQRMTQKLRSEYSWLPQDVDAYYGHTTGKMPYGGLLKDQGNAMGIPYSYTFELPRSLWGTISEAETREEASMAPIHRRLCVEFLVNFLLINLAELERTQGG